MRTHPASSRGTLGQSHFYSTSQESIAEATLASIAQNRPFQGGPKMGKIQE
jgi:hypothetical protein